MTRILCLLYVLASSLVLHASIVSTQHDAPGYAVGFAAVDLLLLVAALREHLAAEERRAVAVRAERLARLRALVEAEQLAHIEMDACCETWWTSAGAEHDAACLTHRRAA
ncbi:hypothetical protein [Streptomyces sp. NPDC004685]